MKAQLLVLTSAGLLMAAVAAHAAPSAEIQQFLDKTRDRAAQRIERSGVDLAGHSVKVTARVSGDRFATVRVTGSSGSRDTDDAVASALRKLPLDAAPAELSGRQITFSLGAEPIAGAAATQ